MVNTFIIIFYNKLLGSVKNTITNELADIIEQNLCDDETTRNSASTISVNHHYIQLGQPNSLADSDIYHSSVIFRETTV